MSSQEDIETGGRHPKNKNLSRKISSISIGGMSKGEILEIAGTEELSLCNSILEHLCEADKNGDGVIDRKEFLQLMVKFAQKFRTDVLEQEQANRKIETQNLEIKSKHRIIGRLSCGALFLLVSCFGLTIAGAFMARDTSVQSNVLTAKGSNEAVRVDPVTTNIKTFAPHLDTMTPVANAGTASPNAPTNKNLGCVPEDLVKSMVTRSLSTPVILTSPNGALHKIEGHDVVFGEEGGATVTDTNAGMVYHIKKDPMCAKSTEGRRLASIDLFAMSVEGISLQNSCEIRGTNKADEMYGSDGADTFYGLGGNDIIKGRGGIDHLYGGDGEDILDGGDGFDIVYADGGNDIIIAGPGDYIEGGVGIDIVVFDGKFADYSFEGRYFTDYMGDRLIDGYRIVAHPGGLVLPIWVNGIERFQFKDMECTAVGNWEYYEYGEYYEDENLQASGCSGTNQVYIDYEYAHPIRSLGSIKFCMTCPEKFFRK